MRHRTSRAGGAAVVFAVSLVGISRIEIGTDIIRYFPQEHRLRAAFDAFNARLGGARRVDIMVEGARRTRSRIPSCCGRFNASGIRREPSGRRDDLFVRRHHPPDPPGNERGGSAFRVIPDSRDLVAQSLLLSHSRAIPATSREIVDYDYQRTKIRVMLDHLGPKRASPLCTNR